MASLTISPLKIALRTQTASPEELHEIGQLALAGIDRIASKADLRRESFETLYRNQYNASICGHRETLYKAIISAFARMARCMPEESYKFRTQLIRDTSFFLEASYVARFGLPSLEQSAIAAYEAPAARGWRCIRAWVQGTFRTLRWRLAFNAVSFKPGGVGAKRAAAHFEACVKRFQT